MFKIYSVVDLVPHVAVVQVFLVVYCCIPSTELANWLNPLLLNALVLMKQQVKFSIFCTVIRTRTRIFECLFRFWLLEQEIYSQFSNSSFFQNPTIRSIRSRYLHCRKPRTSINADHKT
ncbi:hypothetical protein QVD17_26054 [Tagetes erecta]|uniref:Uncharacterized protein n=1 Tax=Tagetes erecta TaxID=13708 RepID=A0AAD8KC58_TARER|nr:hypothetical protein QVD17_26054 [Tagetes erecta]